MGVFSDDPALDSAMFFDWSSGSSGGGSSSGSGGGCGGCFGVLIIIGLVWWGVSKCSGTDSHDNYRRNYSSDYVETTVEDTSSIPEFPILDTTVCSSSVEPSTYRSSSSSSYHRSSSSYDYDDDDEYDEDGYDSEGYDRDGYDRNGYDRDGYDEEGFDEDGIDEDGYDEDENYTGDW